MFAQHVVDFNGALDRGVLLQLADLDDRRAAGVEQQAQAVAAQEAGSVADHGIAGDTTLKHESVMVVRADLAEKIYPCQQASGLRSSGLVGPVHVGDHRHHAGGVGLNAEEGADRDPRRFDGKLGVCVKTDVG